MTTSNNLWPDELDALVAAPEYHELLMENERVRVVRTRIPAGHRTPVHTHRWPGALHIVSWSHYIRRDDNDHILVDSRTVDAFKNPAEFTWSAALPPHSLENVGDTELHVISVEIKGE